MTFLSVISKWRMMMESGCGLFTIIFLLISLLLVLNKLFSNNKRVPWFDTNYSDNLNKEWTLISSLLISTLEQTRDCLRLLSYSYLLITSYQWRPVLLSRSDPSFDKNRQSKQWNFTSHFCFRLSLSNDKINFARKTTNEYDRYSSHKCNVFVVHFVFFLKVKYIVTIPYVFYWFSCTLKVFSRSTKPSCDWKKNRKKNTTFVN